MPRLGKPYPVTFDQVRITREGETATVEYIDGQISTVSLRIGPELAEMSDQQILDQHNQMLQAQRALADSIDWTAVEVPPGSPQVDYFEDGEQWVPMGGVLRCLINDDEHGHAIIEIDGREFTMEAFSRLLATYAGWGMRITFVPEDEVEQQPTIEVRKPGDR
jgi:hypothetical protein